MAWNGLRIAPFLPHGFGEASEAGRACSLQSDEARNWAHILFELTLENA